jgi:hypothetical protein
MVCARPLRRLWLGHHAGIGEDLPVGVIPGALFPNADRVRAVRDAIIAMAPPLGTPLTDDEAIVIADLFEGDVGLLLFMREHPGHWICLSGNEMGDGPVSVDKDVWHSRLVEAADQHHAFWARLAETTPPTNW